MKNFKHFLQTLLFFVTSGIMYGQREIISVEESFTYEYALKYCINLPVLEHFPDYWFLENFMAPNRVKSIEVYPYKDKTTFLKRIPEQLVINGNYVNTDNCVFVHFYSIEHGFLERTMVYPYNKNTVVHNEESGILYKTYQYQIDEDTILIDVHYPNSEDRPMQYIFDKDSGNLLEIRKKLEDSTSFLYENDANKFQKSMLVEVIDKAEKYVINTSKSWQSTSSISSTSLGDNYIFYDKDESEIPTVTFNRSIENIEDSTVTLVFSGRELRGKIERYDQYHVHQGSEVNYVFLFDNSKRLTHSRSYREKIQKKSYEIIGNIDLMRGNLGSIAREEVGPITKRYLFGLIEIPYDSREGDFSLVKRGKKKWARYDKFRIAYKYYYEGYDYKKTDKIRIRNNTIFYGKVPLISYKY
ncbi:hypothetical protein ACKUSY_16260 [Myroides odoratus]